MNNQKVNKKASVPQEFVFARLIYKLQSLLTTGADRILNEDGRAPLTSSQFMIISCIIRTKQETDSDPNQGDIAKALAISAPAISRHIDNLLLLGYVTCVTNKTNRRQNLISITKKGEKAFARSTEILSGPLKKVLGVISETERKTLLKNLEKIQTFMEENPEI